jgi:hypothetical protein
MGYQHLFWFFLYLWIVPHLLLLAVAIVMFRKKLHKQYPIFFLYLLFGFLEFCVVFTMSRLNVPAALYVKVDLMGRIGDAALSFGIIQELFAAVLVDLGPMQNPMVRVLRWTTVALVLLASLFIATLCYSSVNPGSFRPYWSMEALDIAQCSLLFLVFLWHRFLGVRMRSLTFGIALGMGLVAAVDLVALAFKTSMVVLNGRMLDMLNMAAYHAAVLTWLYFALVRGSVAIGSLAFLTQLHERATELGRLG